MKLPMPGLNENRNLNFSILNTTALEPGEYDKISKKICNSFETCIIFEQKKSTTKQKQNLTTAKTNALICSCCNVRQRTQKRLQTIMSEEKTCFQYYSHHRPPLHMQKSSLHPEYMDLCIRKNRVKQKTCKESC